ncbi:MAG: hypothetical protein IJL26_07900 [Clostridia bacterium]|nr:hypothetical protein [Clostridia bacterium]
MKNRFFLVFLSLVIIASFFSGCNRAKSVNLAYPVLDDVRTFDPQYASSPTALTVNANVFDCLVTQDKNGEIRPAAAEKWEKNGAEYTFRLNKDLVWRVSDTVKKTFEGKIPKEYAPAFTAHDFVFALQRLASPQTNSPWSYMFDAIAGFYEARTGAAAPESIGVRAVSDDTLTISTAYEDADLLKKLAHPAAAPCCEEFFNLCAGRYGLGIGYLLTNGPYALTRWETKTYFRIAKYAGYKGPRKAFADSVWFYLNDDAAKMNEKLAAGTYAAGVTSTAAFDRDAVGDEYTLEDIDDVLYALIFNCAGEGTSIAALRQALTRSVNKSLFDDEAVGYFPRNTVPKLPAGTTGNLPPTENAGTAKDALRDGLAELDDDEAEIVILCAERHEELLKQQMQHWQKSLGVPVNIRISPVGDAELQTAVAKGEYQAAYYPLEAKECSPVDFLSRFVTGASGNLMNYASEVFDDAFARLSMATAGADAAAALNTALAALSADCAYLPLRYDGTCLLRSANCADLYYTDSTALMYFVKY